MYNYSIIWYDQERKRRTKLTKAKLAANQVLNMWMKKKGRERESAQQKQFSPEIEITKKKKKKMLSELGINTFLVWSGLVLECAPTISVVLFKKNFQSLYSINK